MKVKKNIKKKNIVRSLRKVGLKKGDTVFVHLDISTIGLITGGIKKSLEIYYQSIITVIGKKGTISAPAYFWEFNKNNLVFDINKSPISNKLGLFPKFLNNLKGSYLSPNPMSSVVAIGKNAKLICSKKTGSAYGVDSPFDVLTKLNAKMLFLGVDLRYMTYVHYVEHMVGVPHRYFKYFCHHVYDNGKKIKIPIISYVKFLKFNITGNIKANNKKFESARLVKKVNIGNSNIRCLEFKKTYEFLKRKIQRNCFYLLKKKPNFKKGQIPLS